MGDERRWKFLVPVAVAAAAVLSGASSLGAAQPDDLLLRPANPPGTPDHGALAMHGSHSSHSSHSSHGSSR
jgi:hypothetical protein